MATLVTNFYFDGLDWCLANAVFTDNRMDTFAPVGWYKFNNRVRYFNGTTLGPCVNC
jgi:hypothetical protein